MPNTSASGGYLVQSSAPTEGAVLRKFIHDIIVGVTGLANENVRPLWQKNPPPIPNIEVDWCAFGITGVRADANAYHNQIPPSTPSLPGGAAEIVRHEELDILCVFYGDNNFAYTNRLRDGVQLAQNREVLMLAGAGLVGFSDSVHAPELVNERWLDRVDVTMTIRREVKRQYAVLNFVAAGGTIVADRGTETLNLTWSA